MAFSKSCARLGAVVALALVLGASAHAAGFAGRHKAAEPGYLGIMFHDVNDGEVVTLHLKDRHGAEIIMVDHDGPAGKAGLREHDVVLSLNGVTVDGEDGLRKMLRDLPPGRTVSLYICREGSERTVAATLAIKADVDKSAMAGRWTVPTPPAGQDDPIFAAAPAETLGVSHGFGHGFVSRGLMALTPAYTGATVDAMGAQLADFFGVKDGRGLLVHEVEGNSPAAAAGLRAGDVVTKVNGSSVGTEKDWTRALRDSKGHTVSLTVVRERKEELLTMVPDSKKRSAADVPLWPNELPVMEPRPVVM